MGKILTVLSFILCFWFVSTETEFKDCAEVINNLTSSFVAVLTPELAIAFPYNRTDVCSRLQNAPEEESKYSTAKECPVGPGTEVIYYTVLPLEDEYPQIRATIQWRISDQNNNTVACVEVLCELL